MSTGTVPPSLPTEVDAIFVGGGHNSLVAAGYLARAGLDILVLEANEDAGGGVTTEEVTAPSFLHNLHAYFVRWTSEDRIWKDLDLSRYGVASIRPEVQNGILFDEGRDALLSYSDLPRSLAAIDRLSADDAQTYARLYGEYSELIQRIDSQLRFAPPLSGEEQRERLGRSALGRRYLEIADRSALDVVMEAFSSEPLRTLILFNVSVRGYLPSLDVPGTGYCALLALVNSHDVRMIRGGSREMAEALTQQFLAAGGQLATSSRVGRIIVEGGRATGVETTDGRRVTARRMVASSVPAVQTLLELVGSKHLDPSLAGDLEGHRGLQEGLFGGHYALRRRPTFRVEGRHPDFPHAINLAIGYEQISDLLGDMEAVRSCTIPDHTAVHASFPTVHDPSQAPPGSHTTFGWQFVAAYNADGTDRVWSADDDKEQLARITELYRHYAPDFEDCVIEAVPHSPTATAKMLTSMPRGDRHHGSYDPDNWGENRPHRSLANYRTPVDGLYLCGASQHPGGSFNGTPGFNAAGVIADDLDLEIWWDRPDVRDALSAFEV